MFGFVNISLKSGATGTALRTRALSRRKTRVSKAVPVAPPVAGFTLVELLVSLGLVSLIMLLFSQVFTIATGTMSTQRGIMENDQRARSLSIIMTNDLNNRSLRWWTPFQPGEVDYASSVPYSFTQRQGFASVSENDPNNDADDVLHFTAIFSAQNAGDTTSDDANVYYGKAMPLPIIFNNQSQLQQNTNQPEIDDGSTYPNWTATSHTAEIVYFLRNGNLYRRVLLIREPLDDTFNNQPNYLDFNDLLPSGLPKVKDYFDPANGMYPSANTTSNFWADFDFSARYDSVLGYLQFAGAGNNASPLVNSNAGTLYPIAKPMNRFGHDADFSHRNGNATTGSIGNPREYVFDASGNANAAFIGRFTQEETSHSNFNYPRSLSATVGNAGGNGNPMDQGFDMRLNTSGAVSSLSNSTTPTTLLDPRTGSLLTRRGEDLLMTNVHAFDVKVWDELIGDYVDVGYGGATVGDFHQSQNRRPSYGPQSAGNRIFDTWHPSFDANNDLSLNANDGPPFLPKIDYTVTTPWAAGHTYALGEKIIPLTSSIESFYYVCTTAGTGGTTEPIWPTNTGQYVQDGTAVLQAVYNLKPVKSLKITVRYLDATSDQMRQVTLIQSLMN